MPKVPKKSAHDNTPMLPEESGVPKSPDLDQEVSFHPSLAHPAHPVQQAIPSMFMLYIEGPKMDWTINDGLYYWLLKWRLKLKHT